MGLGMDIEIIIAYVLALVLLYFIGYALYKVFAKPLQWIGILLFNGIVGGLILFAINWIGEFFDFHIALNPITALTVGFLGVPGVALIVVINTFF